MIRTDEAAGRDRLHVSSWEQGASAERIVGAYLDRLADVAGIAALHDRRVPGSRVPIEHIAVGPAGVFVIDARLSGRRPAHPQVRRFVRPADGFDTTRDREKVLAKLAGGVQAVSRTVADTPVAVTSALCLVELPGAPARDFMLDGVWVGTPEALPGLVARPGLLDGEAIRAIAARLDVRLPPG